MKSFALFCLVAGTVAAPAAESSNGNPSASGQLGKDKAVVDHMHEVYRHNTQPLLQGGTCNEANARVRKSWSRMTKPERKDYLRAVNCLYKNKSTVDPSIVPGARNRLDDFTWSHINQTKYVHNSGLLLPWHRAFLWGYETTLREECGYKGAQPYWDVSEHALDQSKSPVWDGSETSFGGNGKYVPHGTLTGDMPGISINGKPFVFTREAGTGGGCVTDGGFANMTINLGPTVFANNTADNLYGTHYNPRCLHRDWLQKPSEPLLNYTAVANTLRLPTIHEFRPSVDAGLHPDSHGFVGGDNFDIYVSPVDPIFYMIHTNVDRVWTIWQGQDYASRGEALDGTVTFFNSPPSANATGETTMYMGAAGGEVPLSGSFSAVKGRHCYVYE